MKLEITVEYCSKDKDGKRSIARTTTNEDGNTVRECITKAIENAKKCVPKGNIWVSGAISRFRTSKEQEVI